MSEKKINIKSSTIESGLEIAKGFLKKLIYPSIEEFGLFLADNVKYIRYKNQVKILNKTKVYVEKNNIKIKEIPIKILVPLLESASLEENESLQDKWAKLLANMIDSKSNYQNQIFPYLLSQLSIEEWEELKNLYNFELDFENTLKDFDKLKEKWLTDEYLEKENKIISINQNGFNLKLEPYEQVNLERLGLIRKLPPKVLVEQSGGFGIESLGGFKTFNAEYEFNKIGFRLTHLGEKFILSCEINHK